MREREDRHRERTIGVVIPLIHEPDQPLTDPFFMEMLGHLSEEITRRGYAMLLQTIAAPRSDWLLECIDARRSAGLIIVGQSTEHLVIEAAARTYRPLVVWGGLQQDQHYCSVGTDNVAGARLAVQHLIHTGRRRIVFFGDPSVPEIQQRYLGYQSALANSALHLAGATVVESPLLSHGAYDAMQAYFTQRRPFDAVFAATDVLAIAAIRALGALGLKSPRDVSIIGFDDIPLASCWAPTLSTVRQDFGRGAKVLVDSLLRAMEGERMPSQTIAAQLIVRESSAGSFASAG